MGRAIIRRPQAFLMDEPLSNLDAKLRVQMRVELLELHRRLRVTTLYVTHDQTEAMTLGDRVVVLNRGVAQQIATPQHLYRHPSNLFVASFIGSPAMNLFRGRLENGAVRLGRYTIPLEGGVTSRLTRRAEDVVVGLRPEDLVIAAAAEDDSFPATVAITEQLGPETLAFVRIPDLSVVEEGADRPAGLATTVAVRLDGASDVQPESTLDLAARADRVQLFDSSTGESLLRAPDTR